MRFIASIVLLLLGIATTVFGQTDQRALAAGLLSVSRDVRDKSVSAIRSMRPDQVGPEVRTALITLLERLNAAEEKARTSGFFLQDIGEDPEAVAHVHHAVAGLMEPRAIPAMARALGTFTMVRALVTFGEPAARPVLDVVSDQRADYNAVDDGLRILRLMVEMKSVSPATLDQIRKVAHQRLTSEEKMFTTTWYAMDLAIALNDPELRQIVQDLADHPSESHRRGITNGEVPDLVEKTQKRAADRLAGVRPQPTAESLFRPAPVEP